MDYLLHHTNIERKPLLVGQAPSSNSDPSEPLSGASGRRLAKLAGVSYPEYLEIFQRTNLIDHFPGHAKGGGDKFDMALGRAAAMSLLPEFGRRSVVLMGRKVATCFSLGGVDYLNWQLECRFGSDTFDLIVMPHPSGMSRWWANSKNVRLACEIMQELRDEAALLI